MSAGRRQTILQLVLPVIGVAILTVVVRMRGLSLTDIGITWPGAADVALWTALFVALAVVQELLWRALRFPGPEPWRDKYSRGIVVARAVAIMLLAPVAEELVFRGWLYHDLAHTWLGRPGAIGVPALLFAALHVQHGLRGLPFVLVNGLFYGLTRDMTGSVLLPMVLHALGNTYAVWQRLARTDPGHAGAP